jgi:YfiH family protein
MTLCDANASGLRHDLLAACDVAHGFGTRASVAPQDTQRPLQVHGCAVATLSARGGVDPSEADAIVSDLPGRAVGVITADCVPILACCEDGSAVAAIHAGWRGLAEGVVAAGIEALRAASPPQARVCAVVGPCIGVCCYEVDAPVLDALGRRFGDLVVAAVRPSREGHAYLDLAALVREDLLRSGLADEHCASLPNACTRCDAERFHSYRRDGPRAGRLVHHVAAR